MDFLYEHDRKFSDFGDPDMTDIMGPDMFTTSSMGVDDSFMTLPSLNESDNDWFNSIFDDQGLVYNDKNLGEAATQPCIKSEHSYSVSNLNPSSPLTMTKIEDTDTAIFNPHSNALDLTQKAQLIQAAATATQPGCIKTECSDSDPILASMTSADTTTTLTRPATIILATTSSTTQAFSHHSQSVFPTTTVQIKTEPMEHYDTLQEQTVNVDAVVMPPTPPSSAGSDSDGSQSPQRSAPNSPQHQSPVRVYQYHHLHHYHHASSPLTTSTCAAQTLGQQSLFLSPMPQSGVLILSEEEKRTLISEGYPIPAKLPLTKQEEKNLKKVRRKIKNKISAQESRRKKKEYLEALEKRVESFNHENSDLKRKVESLENNNRSLMGQLAKLQAAIAKVPRSAAASATQTGTVLMVLVLCFAVFLGGSGMGPSSLNVGYPAVGQAALSFQRPGPLRPQPNMGPGPARAEDTADDYTTPNLKSRVLMALSKEEPDDFCDEYRPLVRWDKDQSCASNTQESDVRPANLGPTDPGVDNIMPLMSKVPQAAEEDTIQQNIAVVTVAVGAEKNATESVEEFQAMMHPDIAVAPSIGSFGNFSADLETA